MADIIVPDPPPCPLRIMCIARTPQSFAEGMKLAKTPFGLYSMFDRSVILLQDIVQILDRSMSAAAAQDSFGFHCGDRRAVETGLIADEVLMPRGFGGLHHQYVRT